VILAPAQAVVNVCLFMGEHKRTCDTCASCSLMTILDVLPYQGRSLFCAKCLQWAHQHRQKVGERGSGLRVGGWWWGGLSGEGEEGVVAVRTKGEGEMFQGLGRFGERGVRVLVVSICREEGER